MKRFMEENYDDLDSMQLIKDIKKEAREEIIRMLKKWNCQENSMTRTTINTIIFRIEEMDK